MLVNWVLKRRLGCIMAVPLISSSYGCATCGKGERACDTLSHGSITLFNFRLIGELRSSRPGSARCNFWFSISFRGKYMGPGGLKMADFCDVAQCSLLDVDGRFRGTYCLHYDVDQ
jgi:hypothetical protein